MTIPYGNHGYRWWPPGYLVVSSQHEELPTPVLFFRTHRLLWSGLRGQVTWISNPHQFLNHMYERNTCWWFQPLWKIFVKMGIFPKVRGENKKYLKLPPRIDPKPAASGNQGIFRASWNPDWLILKDPQQKNHDSEIPVRGPWTLNVIFFKSTTVFSKDLNQQFLKEKIILIVFDFRKWEGGSLWTTQIDPLSSMDVEMWLIFTWNITSYHILDCNF